MLVGQLVPESIAASNVTQLGSDYAGKGRSQHGAGQRFLGDATRPKIDVSGMSEDG